LTTELPNGLSTEQLILTEVPVEGDEEQEPVEMAVRTPKVLIPKAQNAAIKQGATQARQYCGYSSRGVNWARPNQLEEMLKGNFKTLKEFVGVLREYRQAKPGAESALIILMKLFSLTCQIQPSSSANSSTEMDALHLILRRLQIELRRLKLVLMR